MRVISLNVNGLRSAANKGLFEWMRRQEPDVVCLQEIRAEIHDLPRRARAPRGWSAHFHSAQKKGYGGVAIYARREPDRVEATNVCDELHQEGRYLQADFGKLSVVSLYLPSGSSGPIRQAAKFRFLEHFTRHLIALKKQKRELLIAGDFNIAHREIDLENFRGNRKSSGFLPEERAWLDRVYGELGWVDAFRKVNGEERHYTFWSNRGQAWKKNVGWRIDLQITTPGLAERVERTAIYKRKRFSDHAPLTIDYDWPFSL
jgi:exodeoxyribonuclease-3